MRKASILLPICLVAAAAPGVAATRGFAVPGFDRVRSAVPFDVRVHAGPGPRVVASGDQAVLDRLDIGVRGGELAIHMRRGGGWFSSWRGSRATIDVTVPWLRAVALSGPGNIDVDRIRNPDVTLDLSGPGNIAVGMLEAERLAVSLSGPGNVSAAGRAVSVRIDASGPGNVRLARLPTRDIDVTMSGPGGVDATASGNASVRLSGPGDVRIGGTPRCRVQKSGPGSVRCG